MPAGHETHSTPKGVSIYAGSDGYKHATTTWLFVNFVDRLTRGSLLSLAH